MTIQKDALTAIVTHARAALPAECCGLLIGTDNHIQHAVPVTNVALVPDRYELDPREHIEARRVARQQGLDVLGFYHSHPHSPAEPSSTDLAEASYPDHVYLIVRVPPTPDTAADARVFTLRPGGFVNLPLVVTG